MKKSFFVVFTVTACFLLGCATQPAQPSINTDDFGIRFIEKSGGFSMYAPKNWAPVDISQKYNALMGEREDNFSPNITFADEQFAGPVSEYVEALLELFPRIFADFEVLERIEFQTNNGIRGERLTTTGRINDIHARQMIYVIPNKKNTAVMGISCTVSPGMGTKYDDVFDSCVKTFEWNK